MKRIGIITFHRANNLGAMLQAYALEQTLAKKYDTKIIDYRCEKIEKIYYKKRTLKNTIKDIARYILKHKKSRYVTSKKLNFNHFVNDYLNITKEVFLSDNIHEVNYLFDAIVAGSDQIWNPKLTNNDLNYFLQFADNEKKYSYAASFGNETDLFEYGDSDKILPLLESMNTIFVREKSGLNVLKTLQISSSKNVKVVCDPIFLLSKKEWIDSLQLQEKEVEKYILLFLVAPETNSYNFAKRLKEKYGYAIKYINSYGAFEDCPVDCVNCMAAGPIEFLNLLLNAQYIVTTSFHGMAFSLNFNKQFYYELDRRESARNDRLENLSELFNVGCREIKSADQIIDDTELDYDEINIKLQEYSNYSKNLMFDSLKDL